MNAARTLYLHGFASGPTSSKANWFRERFREAGRDLEIPPLVRGPFRDMTISGELDVLGDLLDEHGPANPVTLVGSSLGGYVAALFCAAQAHKVERLILLAPAFGFPTRWIERYDPEELARWRETGATTVYHYGNGRDEELSYRIITDAALYPDYPVLPADLPVLILHGRRDESVPIEYSQTFRELNPAARLVEYDDDHSLGGVLEEMWEEMLSFLSIQAP